MESLNRVELIGNVGKSRIDIVGELAVAKFAVCTQYGYTDTEGNVLMETTWHNVTAWESDKIKREVLEKLPKFCTIADKLVYVKVVGRLRAYKLVGYDGKEISGYEIVASEVEILQ